ncbi:P-loop containing nucleoside triphosphate hydrolase protein [Blastocladiella britannica]|nr:P-loop containing nucleoside triphosphate hydrolase protein [Blastocladiella britannica]
MLLRSGPALRRLAVSSSSSLAAATAKPASSTVLTLASAAARLPRPQVHQFGQHLQQRRHYVTFLSRLAKLRRLPFLLGGSAASAYGYVQYKVSVTTSWLTDNFDSARSTFLDALDSVSSTMSPLQDTFQSRLEFLQQQLQARITSARDSYGSSGSGSSSGPGSGGNSAFPLSGSDDDDNKNKRNGTKKGTDDDNKTNAEPENENDDQFMDLTRKLIEIRTILNRVRVSGNLVLPSIVVIGSQSSGKSSVLEAIVGREFLPKGNNMVTRRPLELTLIHAPELTSEYAEFPQLGLGKVTNFRHVQQTLLDLNMAVPASECISDAPIELRIYSPHVPDLTLVDLPGYIQIHNKNQPRDLKEKIAGLCDKYIQEPNLILAVCAADVDLANSDALRASRRVDPMGLRTIGVLTKMDLVPTDQAVQLLAHNDYPLHLGYVGVVAKAAGGSSTALTAISRKNATTQVGIPTLRTLLMHTLEDRMGSRLTAVADAVDQELAEANYQFKVLYNDRKITAEAYLAECMDAIKLRFKEFARAFGKPQVRADVRAMLEQRIVEICETQYWTDPTQLAAMAKIHPTGTGEGDEEPYAHKLASASAALTKSGVGRSATQLVVDSLMDHMEKQVVAGEPFQHHADTRRKVLQLANAIIRAKFNTTVDQVENTIKPYKFEVECTDLEWAEGAKRAVSLLEREIAESQRQYDAVKATLGRRTLNGMLAYLEKVDADRALPPPTSAETEQNAVAAPMMPVMPLAPTRPHADPARDPLLRAVPTDLSQRPSSSYTDASLAKARTALYHYARTQTLYNRLYAIKSRTCRTPTSQAICPEVFLSCVADKLTYTAVMFIYVELLNEFFFQFPRDVDERLYYDLNKKQIREFAAENGVIRKQLELAERKEVLDLAQHRLRELVRRQEEVARKKRAAESDASRR